jgi:hypothetical protein
VYQVSAGSTQHKQLDGGWFRQGAGARAVAVSLVRSAPGLSWF